MLVLEHVESVEDELALVPRSDEAVLVELFQWCLHGCHIVSIGCIKHIILICLEQLARQIIIADEVSHHAFFILDDV